MAMHIAHRKKVWDENRKTRILNVLILAYNANAISTALKCACNYRSGSGWGRGSVVVKALCYKLEGRGFDSR
jgi:hypothetical protein